MAHICESPSKGGAEVTVEPKPRPQLCARTQLGDTRSLMSSPRPRWHTGVNRGGVGGGGLTSVYSPSVRVAPTSRSDSMEMQRRASDEDRRRNRSVPTSPASHLIFPSACFPCLGSSARAANSSTERVGGGGGGDRKRAEKKV